MTAVLRVLYVDDEPDLLEICKLFLEGSGDFTVATRESAQLAMFLLKQEQLDAIISDFQMPGMDGIQFLIEVRKNFGKIPFILFTGRGREEIVIQAINNGADFYLQKGGEPNSQFAELANNIKKAVDARRGEEAVYTHQTELEMRAEEHRRTKIALEESRDKYYDLYDFAPLGYLTLSENGLINEVNLTGATLLGLERNRLVKAPFSKCIAETDSDPWYRYFMNVKKQEEKLTCNLFLRREDGSTFPARLESVHIPGSSDETPTIRVAFSDISDIRKMEDALRESEEKYRSLFTSMIDGFALIKMIYNEEGKPIDCRYIDVNPSHETLTGLKRDEIIGHTARESIPGLEDYWIEHYGRVDKTGIPEYFENHVKGLNRWFGVSVYRPSPGFVALTFENITERKRIEEELRLHDSELLMQNDELRTIQQSLEESRDQYMNLYDMAPVGYITTSDKGLILKANFTAASLLATELSTLLNCPVTRFIVPEDQDIHYLCRKRLEETNHPQSCELRMLRKGTSSFWAQIIMERVPANEGEKAVISQMILDISERKEAQEALQKSEQEFHSLAEAMPQIVWITRADGWNIYFNQQWVDYTGLTLEESYGHGWNIPFHPDDRQIAWEAWQRATQHNDIYSLECRLRRADGVYRWWLIRGEPLLSSSGEILKWFGTCTDIEEIKRAEEALRESEEKWRSLVNVLPDYISLLDRNGDILFLNRYAEGFGEKEVLGSSVYQYLSVISRDIFEKEIAACLDSREMRRFEHNAEGDHGLIRDYEDFLVPIFEKNKEDRILVVSRDITERRQAEEALAESNAYLNNLFNYANAPIIVWDPVFVITRFNHAFENLTLRSEQDVIGQRLDILFPEESRSRSINLIRKTLEGERWETVEIPILTKDGSVRTVLWNSANIVDPSGSILSTIAQGVDITERKQAEEALRESNTYLNNLLNYANAPIIVWDTENVITRFNHAFENLTLRSEQEVIGQRLDILFPEESKDRSLIEIKKTLEGVRWESVEIPILTKDRKVRTVLWNSANILDPSGSILSTIAQGVDITERKEVEKAFKAANKKLNLLSSITRHDINNQLTVIRGYTSLLQKKQPDPSFANYYEKINTSEDQIASLIQFTKLYENIGVNAPVWQDVGTLVDLAAKDLTMGKIHVDNEIPGGAEVFADPLIARVFYNLLDNAVRHGGKVTIIRFTAKAESREWIIACEDDGEGVLVEDKEKIFKRGFGKNTGLGLFLSREILAINGITIRETGEPGKGARFEMAVPKGAYRLTDVK